MKRKEFKPDRVLSYFTAEWPVLLIVAISGLIYNVGLLAGPYFEGQMTGCLIDILNGKAAFRDMLCLVLIYVVTIAVVQISRYAKRFYVRRFANNVNRRMKQILYGTLVRKSRAQLQEEGVGNVMTKAILDVDDCVEGMRKFTTEIFDTGVALLAYSCMLLWYDWRLALLCMIFPPVSYYLAEKMKVLIQRSGAAFKEQSGRLSTATLDRVSNAITYRVFGCEKERRSAYEENLTAYEKAAVKANIWNAVLPPVYRVTAMTGVLFILYFGGRNVLGIGWTTFDIAMFTTFLSCFTRLSTKASGAAKLFNAVHKAQVSWKRICPLLKMPEESRAQEPAQIRQMQVEHLRFAYPQAKALHNLGVEVDVIAGFRNKDIVILEDEMNAVATNYYLMTDDGSQGEKGFVTDKLKSLIEAGNNYDAVIAIGPIPMMKFVSLTTKPFGIKTIVSLNPIMIDGTGMCGGCRVTVGGKIKFACVDGPDFDGHEVDFDELMNRNSIYKAREAELTETHICRMDKLANELIK